MESQGLMHLQVRFLVMGNVFPTDTRLHRKFDLKGSTYGRTAGARRNDPSATLKASRPLLLLTETPQSRRKVTHADVCVHACVGHIEWVILHGHANLNLVDALWF